MPDPTFGLTPDLLELRERARRVAERDIAPYAAEVDARGAFPEGSLAALVGARLHSVGLPRAYGGPGAGHLAAAVVAEEIARACTTTQQVAGGYELFALPLLLAGSEEQRRAYLPRVADGSLLGAFALSEPEAGSDVAAISTRARPDGDGWVLRGTKRWITNAGRAGAYLVFAATEPDAGARGMSAFVVEAGDPGLSFGPPERKMGLRGSPTCEVYLDDVRVPAERLVGAPGAGMRIALATLDRTRATVAAQATGIAQGALDVVADHLRTRDDVGQGAEFLLADLEIAVRAGRMLTYAAARELDEGGSDTTVAGAVAKSFASDTAMRVTGQAVELLGPAGCGPAYAVERMMRDAKVTQIYEGTNQIQRMVIARALLRA